jgi:transposase
MFPMPKRGAGPGRPPGPLFRPKPGTSARGKRTPARKAVILAALEQGHTRVAAAALAGIHKTTLYDWVAVDPALAEAMDLAEAKAEAGVAQALMMAAGRDWKAAITWLEHRRRIDWKPATISQEVSGPDGGPIELADVRRKVASILDKYAVEAGPGTVPEQPGPD